MTTMETDVPLRRPMDETHRAPPREADCRTTPRDRRFRSHSPGRGLDLVGRGLPSAPAGEVQRIRHRGRPATIIRRLVCVAALTIVAGCGSAVPSSPSQPAIAPVSLTLTLSHPARTSVSEPLLCSGDASSCPDGRQAQGPLTEASRVLAVRQLPAGVYRITGILQPTTPGGASVNIHLAVGSHSASRTSAAVKALQAGAVAHTGDLVTLPGVTPLPCGATFYNPSGELEWSVTFRVSDVPGGDQDASCR
jgi:hypothetical protein